ncbi:cyclase family protein [Algoriphagus sp. NG3]|uniref:cyclase family protein n=1 Tax=Algoriphagus sp. NG3 TaxID=3097546 RepID=UPI002A832C7B|nr:cyclase family protein [Algoriphagus sp. NG3]WPR77830.1 cyclase family protein [Algoriphagus sp. NG3]
MGTKRWKHRPLGSNWGDFGVDDQKGRLNLITPEKVKQGIAEVREGITFCLSLPLDYPGGNVMSPVRFPPILGPVTRNNEAYFNYLWKNFDPRLTDIAADDFVIMYTQYSTQWDSLAHRGSLFDVTGNGSPQPVYYNGFKAGEDVILDKDNNSSAHALGIENMATHGVQGRGVMVDLFSQFGEFPRKEVGYEDLMRIIENDKIEIEEGDILCLWTGLDKMIMGMQGKPDPSLKEACAVLDGRDERLLQWISDSGIAAIASDNLAIEATGKPLPEGDRISTLPLHEMCLFKLGIHLGELWYLADLAQWLKENGRYRFLLTAPPLRLTGAVGSPVTPIATV